RIRQFRPTRRGPVTSTVWPTSGWCQLPDHRHCEERSEEAISLSLDRFRGCPMLLVFGSINIDLLVPVPGLPRPGETVLGGDYWLLPGGKGANQALAACRAGASVMMAGAVGKDAFAAAALDLLRRNGVDLALVRQIHRPTGCAAIMVDESGENLIAVASGANADVTAEM